LSGIAMGSGVAILIGGGVLHAIELGALAATPLAAYAPWRMVLLVIGGPGLLWAMAILLIREPLRQAAEGESAAAGVAGGSTWRATPWARVVPIYIVLAAASFVDNAVGAWAPTLLIRGFNKDPAQIGVELGLLLTVGFGGGVLIGGALADRAGARGGWPRKLRVCLYSGLLILPVSLLMNSPTFSFALAGVPLYFALSGIVTAVGFSAILDVVPNRSRGLAMSMSFFLNVALGAGLGPTAVAVAGAHVFTAKAGLGPPLVLTVAAGYVVALAAICAALSSFRARGAVTT
jgi:MFS family permease